MTAGTLKKHKKLFIVLALILVFILTFVTTFMIIANIGKKKLRDSLLSDEKFDKVGNIIDDDVIEYNGKHYYYNEDLINILLIGVDKKDFTGEERGQADALYLISLDTKTDKVNILGISRNTLADIDVLDLEGEAFGTEHKQICLAYAYGGNDTDSSENCVRAVSRLLYGVPINNYYTLHMKSIAEIVDSVGGVKVKIPEDTSSPDFINKRGQTVTLKGESAINFLRMRGESNAPRLERHKEFIASFVDSAKKATLKDLTLPVKVYNKLSKAAITNIDSSSFVYLASKALDLDVKILNIAGQSGLDGQYETFEVDEDQLKELVINSFYKIKN
ncbi:MAG: LCP family protein [Acutalibacteraceae bacterium]|jgi:LCP family protein required for cell wall assembly